MARGLWKRTQRQIGVAGFQLELELACIQRRRADVYPRRDGRNPGNQRRQEVDHPDIGQQQAEGAIRVNGIEGIGGGAQAVGGAEQRAQRIGDLERFDRRLHRVPVADEQRIGELRAQMPEYLADAGLRGRQQLRRSRDAALVQECIQHPQFPQAQFG